MRTRSLIFALAASLPLAATASQPYEALVPAMDIDPAWVITNSVTNVSGQTGDVGQPTMYDVRSSLGVISPFNAPTMGLLFTGNVDTITTLDDYDYPQHGSLGGPDDRATLRLQLQVPDYAQSYSFNFYFLSREYPEWVGDIYNDTFEVFASNPAFSGQIVFDAFGNPVTVNNALFTVTNPSALVGTGFDVDGGTGWVTTTAPCEPGSILDISFEIHDIGDGVWDSAVLLDNFQFSEDDVGGPDTKPDPPDNDPLDIAFLSPKEGDLDGEYDVTIHGSGFDADTLLFVGGVSVEATPGSGGGVLQVEAADWPAWDSPESVDIEIHRGVEVLVLESGFTYWDTSSGGIPPRLTFASPGEASPVGGTQIDIRVEGLDNSDADSLADRLEVLFVDADGTEVLGEIQAVTALETITQILVHTPEWELPEDAESVWVDLHVRDGSLVSDPGYPFLITDDAPSPGTGPGGGSSRRSCDVGGAPAGLLALLALGLRRRRQEVR